MLLSFQLFDIFSQEGCSWISIGLLFCRICFAPSLRWRSTSIYFTVWCSVYSLWNLCLNEIMSCYVVFSGPSTRLIFGLFLSVSRIMTNFLSKQFREVAMFFLLLSMFPVVPPTCLFLFWPVYYLQTSFRDISEVSAPCVYLSCRRAVVFYWQIWFHICCNPIFMFWGLWSAWTSVYLFKFFVPANIGFFS